MVAGRLIKHVDFWKNELQASNFVLNIIKHGYSLPFTTTPKKFYSPNNKSSLRNRKLVEQSIAELIRNRCIREVTEPPHCINPLTVVEGDKPRLVLDLRHVNEYLIKQKFQYENLTTLSEMLEEKFYF